MYEKTPAQLHHGAKLHVLNTSHIKKDSLLMQLMTGYIEIKYKLNISKSLKLL